MRQKVPKFPRIQPNACLLNCAVKFGANDANRNFKPIFFRTHQ